MCYFLERQQHSEEYKLIYVYYYTLHFLQKLYETSPSYPQAIFIVWQRKHFRFPSLFSSRNRSRLTRTIYQIEKCLARTIKTLLHMMFLSLLWWLNSFTPVFGILQCTYDRTTKCNTGFTAK